MDTVTSVKRHALVKDILGQKFGRLKVIKYSSIINGHAHWVCLCDCGREKIICGAALRKPHGTVSCGCFASDVMKLVHTKHGGHRTKTYSSWASMKNRCLNPKHVHYARYGGNGITITERWLGIDGFKNFREDMGERPEGKTLDRKKGELGYFKENCIWSTPKQQARNTSSNRYYDFSGNCLLIEDWCKITGLKRTTIISRLARGWSLERTLTAPLISGRPASSR